MKIIDEDMTQNLTQKNRMKQELKRWDWWYSSKMYLPNWNYIVNRKKDLRLWIYIEKYERIIKK